MAKKKTCDPGEHQYYVVRSWYDWAKDCPHCGVTVDSKASECPECNEDIGYDPDFKSNTYKIWKILVFCKKCLDTCLLSVPEKDSIKRKS